MFKSAIDAFQLSCTSDIISGGFKRSDIYPLDLLEPMTSTSVTPGDRTVLSVLLEEVPDTRARIITDPSFLKQLVLWETD